MENSVDEISVEIQGSADGAAASIDILMNSINNLTSILDVGLAGLTSFNSTLDNLKVTATGFNFDGLEGFKSLFTDLSGVKTTGFSKTLSDLQRIPEITKQLDSKTISDFVGRIKELVTALEPLSGQLDRVSASFASLPSNVSKATNAVKTTTQVAKSSSASGGLFGNLFSGFSGGIIKGGLFIGMLKRVGSTLGGFVTESNNYIENMNLFTVSMGKAAKQAEEFVDKFSTALGVDPSNVMRYMGMFNSLISGFGLSSDAAYTMSKNMTQLSYDMSSFLNIPIDQAMQKLKSGLAGEIEPLRAVGIALDQATLQTTAYSLGIDKKVKNMTRAQKTELLYYQIMQRTSQMQGDMARTLWTPANALRVLQQQFTVTARAIGNIFIPILQAVIPVVMVVTRAIQYLANMLASLFGFSMPTIDYGDMSAGVGGVADGLDNVGSSAGKANKEMDKMLQKFDDLNVINFDKDTGSGGGGGAGGGAGGGSLGIPLPDYDALAGISKQADEIINKLKTFFMDSFGDLDFGPLIASFQNLWSAIEPILGLIGESLLWIWDNLLVPFAKWTIQEALPAFFNLVAGALRVLNPILKAFQVVGIWLWDNFLGPIAKWTGGVIVSVLNNVGQALTNIGNWMSKNQGVVNAMVGTLVAFFAAWKVTQLLAFIQMSGGVVSALKNIVVGLTASTVAKLKDQAETIALTVLYAKDFVVGIAKTVIELGKEAAAWVASTAAKIAAGIASGTITGATIAQTVATAAQTVASNAAAAAQWLLNAALSANPIGLVIVAVAALVAGLAALAIAQNAATKEEKAAAEAAAERLEVTKEQYDAYQSFQEQQANKLAADMVEINNAQRLTEELKGLANEQGIVAEKDQARAGFILNELNNALGTEYQLIGNQIQGYQDLTKEVEKQIQQKKTQILLENEEAKYKEALINLTETETEKTKAKQEVEEALAAFEAKENKENAQRVLDATERYNKLDEMSKGYNENIRIYETATAEMLQGNNEAAIHLLQNRERALLTYEDTLGESADNQNAILKEQAEQAERDFQDSYKRMKAGQEGYNFESVKAAQDYAQKARAEYEKAGKNINDGITQGINSNSGAPKGAISNVASGLLSSFKSKLGIASPSKVFKLFGKYTDEGYALGVENNSGLIDNAMESAFSGVTDIAEDATNSMEGMFTGNVVSNSFVSAIEKVSAIFERLENTILGTDSALQNLDNLEFGNLPETGFIPEDVDASITGTIKDKSAISEANANGFKSILKGAVDAMAKGVSEAEANRQTIVNIGNRKVYSGYGSYQNGESNMYGVSTITV